VIHYRSIRTTSTRYQTPKYKIIRIVNESIFYS